MSEANKAIVRPPVGEIMNGGDLDVIGELYASRIAPAARRWIVPFREAFPDVRMDVIERIAKGDTVAGHDHCSATHLGPWLGHPPTKRCFERIDEVGIFRFRGGRIVSAWSLEDTLERMRQLGLAPDVEASS